MAGIGTTTIDFGATPVANGTFTITDAGVSSTNYVEAFAMGDSTVDNDLDAHKHAAASWKLLCTPASGSFTLDVTCLIDLCYGTFKIRYVYV